MEPLPLKTRRIVSVLFFVLFVAVLLTAVMYASGYRIIERAFERTGGVHVSIPVSGAELSIDGTSVGVSGFLSRSFFVDNLAPRSHTVEVVADGYRVWTKKVIVEPSLVSDLSAFMVPTTLSFATVTASTTATSSVASRIVSEDTYALLTALFEKEKEGSMTKKTASSTSDVSRLAAESAVELIQRDGNVFVRWNRELRHAPNSFCVTPRACVVEVTIESGVESVADAALFKDGVVYRIPEIGIFFAEIDVKEPRIVVPIIESSDIDFRVYEDELYLKDGEGNISVLTDF